MEMQEKIGALYDAIVSLESREQCQELFDDLCTRKEIEKMAERLFAAKLLLEGNTYNQVIAQCGHLLRHSEPGVPVRAVRKGIFRLLKA